MGSPKAWDPPSRAKIDLGKGRFAFVSSADLRDGGAASGAVGFDDIYTHAPPELSVKTTTMATRARITGAMEL